MKVIVVLLTIVSAAFASKAVFSVHDDLLAFPQYQVIISDGFITDIEAERHLRSPPSEAHLKEQQPAVELTRHNAPADDRPPKGTRADDEPTGELYEKLLLKDKEYLCTIPKVAAPEKNATFQAEKQQEHEQELARATDRGWELLSNMEGCLYYISGWWSYSFCHNNQVRQFHQLSPGKGVPNYPPAEDPSVPSFVLGQYESKGRGSAKGGTTKDDPDAAKGQMGVAQLQARGETRYLVQKLGGGTTCDLTGRERKIEVQFHCHPQSIDRIGWIKEVSTCSYLMVVYTPRLCNDVAFLPPRENRAHPITCREITPAADVPAWKSRKSTEIQERLMRTTYETREGEGVKARPIIGGIEVGAKKEVGGDGRRIETSSTAAKLQALEGKDEIVEVVAVGDSVAKGGRVQSLGDEDLRKLELDPKNIEDLRKEVQELAGEKGWRLEIIELSDGTRGLRGVLDIDEETEEGYDEEYYGEDDGEKHPQGEKEGTKREEKNDDENEKDKGWTFKEEL
ncbi:hypothetical protein L228DRAFT_260621 [Xylona heveae TC161]|uniref:Endoplasmic reticulum lectin n=1 Tax=Xylona heveae (strain CBS 132557 / TC161) TaxID=1328760 RepID=A0A161TDE7_XYLHT|nr:hypothetical protein L228DRAFT_260621 [Xylona heveae TC161]KZF23867.1 hypothetical protein L228DRAFT_260621 [Xylona heveae TC161]